MGTNSQLKYGARLINSYLGDNSTVSCCEVLNSLIFPGHEQHHNNSFLCAATIQGQSNMAAGATIGSNHNSRAADGELIAGRGFWPGLCVSVKHNSVFASYSLLAKGDFQAELHIPLPFSLISNNPEKNELLVMPGYWFEYNLYALARNSEKYSQRDKRVDKSIHWDFDYLAPDTVNEMMKALDLLKILTAKAYTLKENKKLNNRQLLNTGEWLLTKNPEYVDELDIYAEGFENSNRPVRILKIRNAFENYQQLIIFYAVRELQQWFRDEEKAWQKLPALLQSVKGKREAWKNAGGQFIREKALQQLLSDIKLNKIKSWDSVHDWYVQQSNKYKTEKLRHSLATLMELLRWSPKQFTSMRLSTLALQACETQKWISRQIIASREKDYRNPFRKKVYDSIAEMETVLGALKDNPFLLSQQKQLAAFESSIAEWLVLLKECRK